MGARLIVATRRLECSAAEASERAPTQLALERGDLLAQSRILEARVVPSLAGVERCGNERDS
jgi:hypothetical protein